MQTFHRHTSRQSARRTKNMASAEKVDAKGLILLSRFILRILKQLGDEAIELGAEAEDKRG